MSWAHYLLQVNIYLIVFYCFYKLLLDTETYFVLNRIYLIAAGLFSLCIPFLRFEWFSKQEVAKPIYVGVDQLNNLVAQVSIINDSTAKFNWGNFIVFIYILGMMFFLGRLIYQLLAVKKLLKTISSGAAFSFLRKKIVADNVPEMATINLHEDIHVKQLHTLDVLFFEFIGVFAWFNPIIYVYKKTIKNIHEYLADEAAAKFQGDKEAYALLLLSQAFGVKPHTLTNGFFTKSLIKKRIFMLHKQRSTKMAILKYGLFLPLFALTLLLSSATIRKNNQILAIAEKIPLNEVKLVVNQAIASPLSVINLAPPPPFTQLEIKTEQPLNTVEVALLPEAGATSWNGFYKYLGDRIKYPTAAIKKKLQGNTVINFSVRRGKISDIAIQDELGEGCDQEVIDQILSYDDFFQKDGSYSIKVSFKLEGADTPFKNENATSDGDRTLQQLVISAYAPKEEQPLEEKVYNFVVMSNPPTYPGGLNKFYEFLGNNIKYPEAAVDNDIQGNVFVSFNVEKDGSLTDVKVERKLGFGVDEEAIRVLKLTKRWNPGLQNGRPVKVKYNLPIKFALDQDVKKSNIKALASIRLKGNNSPEKMPLIVIDGVVKEGFELNDLDMDRIEQINIFKDAQAVNLYGNEGKNGAIVITLKKQKSIVISARLTNRS